jgi:hypothetical protein
VQLTCDQGQLGALGTWLEEHGRGDITDDPSIDSVRSRIRSQYPDLAANLDQARLEYGRSRLVIVTGVHSESLRVPLAVAAWFGRPCVDRVAGRGAIFQVSLSDREATEKVLSQALHTDDSQHPDPVDTVALWCTRPDPEGGDSLLLSVDAVLEQDLQLGESDSPASLIACALPFCQKAPEPVVSWFRVLQVVAGRFAMRYKGSDIRRGLQLVDPEHPARGLARRLTAAIDGAAESLLRTGLDNGELLLFDNHRWLHGRSYVPAGSDREMWRIKLRREVQF